MPFSLKSVLMNPAGLCQGRESSNISGSYEEVTEAMAERLASRAPKLLRGLNILEERNRDPRRHTMELQKWLDKEKEELFNLKKTIDERKRSYLKAFSENAKVHLRTRHPVWISTFNMCLDQVQDLFAIHKEERTVVQCIVGTNVLECLKIYYYASSEAVLCINSDQSLSCVSDETSMECDTDSKQGLKESYPSDEYIFRPFAGGHARWIFTGNRWGLDNYILWLDFGKC